MKRFAVLSLVLLGAVVASSAFMTRPALADPPNMKIAEAPAGVDSVALLEKEVARDSSKFDRDYRLGVLYMDRERMLEALRVFAKAHELRPKDVKVLVNMGIAADAVGHPENAQQYYGQALTLAPNDSLAACRMASSLYAQGKYDESMNGLRAVIAKNPRAHCAYFTLGVAFADAGIYRDAIRMWKKVIELAPDSPEAVSAKESIDVLEKFLAGSK